MAKVVSIDGGKIRMPSARDRITVVGSTGSGKTQAGLWHLSNASFNVRPYILIDHKMDDSIAEIDCPRIGLGEIPKYPGLYVCNPLPSEADELDAYLMDIWSHENIGLYFDEGYMVPDGPGLTACLTQGRSKHIPCIMLSQRPVEISRFAFSEAQFFQVFRLNDKRDQKTVRNFAPIPDYYKGDKLPDFWSFYYDVSKNKLFAFKPVPKFDETMGRIEARLQAMEVAPPRRRYL